jgi:hypothetical protein
MHLLRHPRNAALLGLIFLGIDVFYVAAPLLGGGRVDYAGATMLAALSIAMAFMAYVVAAGTPHD